MLQEVECTDGGVYGSCGSTGRRHLLHAGQVTTSAALLQSGRITAAAERCKTRATAALSCICRAVLNRAALE